MRFFFDISDDESLSPDREGLDLPNLMRAKAEAVAALPALARETPQDRDRWAIQSRVRNETGEIVFEATLRFEAKHFN